MGKAKLRAKPDLTSKLEVEHCLAVGFITIAQLFICLGLFIVVDAIAKKGGVRPSVLCELRVLAAQPYR